MELSKLISALERCQGPSVELDAEIAKTTGAIPQDADDYSSDGSNWTYYTPRRREWDALQKAYFLEHHTLPDAPAPQDGPGYFLPYTDSMDAAVTLVRPKDDIDYYKIANDCGTWFVMFKTLIKSGAWVETGTVAGSEHAALEFCIQYFRHIASLRARAQQQEKE